MSAQCQFCQKAISMCTCELISYKPAKSLPVHNPFPTSITPTRFVYKCSRCKKIFHEALQSKPTPEQAKKLLNQFHDIVHMHECARTDGVMLFGVAHLIGIDVT